MRKTYRILSLLLVVVFVLGGCGKKRQEKTGTEENAEMKEKEYPSYQCDFPFENVSTAVSVTKNGETVTVSNAFDKAALSLYEALKTDRLEPMGKPDDLKEEESISFCFNKVFPTDAAEETPEFVITKSDILIFRKEEGEQYFGTEEGVYADLSGKSEVLFAEKNTCCKADKNMLSLLKPDGSVAKEQEFSGRVILYKKNVLLLEDTVNTCGYFYDREKAILSQKIPAISDYCEGYVCFADGEQIKLESISDQNFRYSGTKFEKPLQDSDHPFISVNLTDKNTAEIAYYTDTGERHAQTYDLSAFYKDYEAKKAEAAKKEEEKAASSAPKPQAPAVNEKYEYVAPSFSTASGIPPYTAQLEAKLMKLVNTKKGYGWKGSEERQSYYAKYNAYATGDRSQNAVYLTFDEGYEYNENTNKILDILKAKNVKAVFFVTMDFAKKRPDLVRRMIAEGHTVGNHSTTHPSFPSISLQDGYNEILNLHNYILTNFGYTMNLFRFPEGASSDRTLALVSEMGYASVFWNCAYADWDTAKQPSADTTRALVANHTKNGTIYLFHAVSNTNVSMLAEIIDTVRSAGYEFRLFGRQ